MHLFKWLKLRCPHRYTHNARHTICPHDGTHMRGLNSRLTSKSSKFMNSNDLFFMLIISINKQTNKQTKQNKQKHGFRSIRSFSVIRTRSDGLQNLTKVVFPQVILFNESVNHHRNRQILGHGHRGGRPLNVLRYLDRSKFLVSPRRIIPAD